MKSDELIPIEQVLADMYADKGIISSAARDYYKTYYATEDELIIMKREERLETIAAYLFILSPVIVGIIASIFDHLK